MPSFHTVLISIPIVSSLKIFAKHLKFQKLTLFCATSVLSRSARMHIWAGIPSGEHTHPNRAQISWWNPPQLPQPREFLSEYLLFCSSEEMRVREAEGSGGGGLLKLNHHGYFNNISLPLPPPPRKHKRKWVSKRRRRFSRHLFLTPAKQQRHHWLDKDSLTVLLLCIILQHRKARRC